MYKLRRIPCPPRAQVGDSRRGVLGHGACTLPGVVDCLSGTPPRSGSRRRQSGCPPHQFPGATVCVRASSDNLHSPCVPPRRFRRDRSRDAGTQHLLDTHQTWHAVQPLYFRAGFTGISRPSSWQNAANSKRFRDSKELIKSGNVALAGIDRVVASHLRHRRGSPLRHDAQLPHKPGPGLQWRHMSVRRGWCDDLWGAVCLPADG